MAIANNEFAYIDWLRKQTPKSPQVLVGPGDDAAVVQWNAPKNLVITTDMLLEKSCFLLEQAGARRVGRKAMAVNLSDIAAMAAVPIAAVVSVGLPRTNSQALAQELYQGLREMADLYQTQLVGGDTNTWTGDLVISVTVIGETTERGSVLRSGAKVGDWIFVTGSLGGSILGKHLDFQPRVREALQLHQHVDLHAMIDSSDGLAKDLHHICEESNCGAILQAEQIPISAEAIQLAQRDGQTPLQHALSDGEDFELIFTVSPEDGERLLNQQPVSGLRLYKIGECVEQGYWLETKGVRSILLPQGYEHAFG